MKSVIKACYRYFRTIKKYAENYYVYLSSEKRQFSHRYTDEKILIDISNTKFRDRNFSNFLMWLILYGYEVHIRGNLFAIASFGVYCQKVLTLQNVKIVHRRKSGYFAVFTDRNDLNIENRTSLIRMQTESDVTNRNNSSFAIPLGLHPKIYFEGYHANQWVDEVGKIRDIRILFSGNMDERIYGKNKNNESHLYISRLEIRKRLVNSRLSSKIIHPQKMEEISENGSKYPIVLHDKTKFIIPMEEFLGFVRRSDFFLFCPPYSYPVCHNNYEAMSVGSIPILQYPRFFSPELEHGKNCIVFRDEDDLIDKLEYVLAMEEDAVLELRKNVLEYYRTTQSYQSVIRKLTEKITNQELTHIYFRISLDHGFLPEQK